MENAIRKMLVEDKLYDKKSLVFEGGTLREISDPLDSDKLPEGRLGEFPLERFRTAMGITLYVPITKASGSVRNAVPITNSEELFEVCTADRYLSLEKNNANDGSAILRNNEADLAITENNDGEERLVGFIETPEGDKMLGIAAKTEIGNVDFVFVYAGIGNFTDIKMEMENVIRFLRSRSVK